MTRRGLSESLTPMTRIEELKDMQSAETAK
jgi:hypothetical protein